MPIRNIDYSDLELLYVIASVAGPEGISTSADVAEQLGIRKEKKRTPAGLVSTRLAWMQRYGYLERLDSKLYGRKRSDALWAITRVGRELMTGRLNASVARTFETANAGTQVLLMRELMNTGYVNGRAPVANAIRREYLHNLEKRRDARR